MDGTRIDCHYNLYLHHLGTTADRAGLDRLNRRGHTGGTRGAVESEEHWADSPVDSSIRPGQTVFIDGWS